MVNRGYSIRGRLNSFQPVTVEDILNANDMTWEEKYVACVGATTASVKECWYLFGQYANIPPPLEV